MSFYTQVLLELVAATGGALAFGNALALLRRRRDRAAALERAHATPGATDDRTQDGEQQAPLLTQAPVFRSLVFFIIGLVACVWSLATLFAA